MNETQYVSEINGYKIKDSEAREKIGNLSNIIKITGSTTLTTEGEVDITIPFPDNFNKSNAFIVSVKYDINESGLLNIIPMVYTDIQTGTLTGRINCVYSNSGITIYGEGAIFHLDDQLDYELVLIKI